MGKHLALFDFDGTITRKDTFIVFIRYYAGRRHFYTGFALLSPVLILYKLKLIANWRAKEIVFSYFFKNVKREAFCESASSFAKNILPGLIRSSAVTRIKEHLASGDRVIIVTASAAEWIKPWSDQFGIEVIATEWQENNGMLTGRIKGRNCYGDEKKVRILAALNPADYETISVYGDTSGDKAMLSLGTKKHYRFFTV